MTQSATPAGRAVYGLEAARPIMVVGGGGGGGREKRGLDAF